MKRSVKVAPAAVEQASVPTVSVTEELPDSAPATKKVYTDAQSVADFFATPEELVSFPRMKLRVGTSKNNKPVLTARHNGSVLEVYEAYAGEVFPDGLVAGSTVEASFDVRKHDGLETRVTENCRYITAFAVNVSVA